jgi:hypothetical protein
MLHQCHPSLGKEGNSLNLILIKKFSSLKQGGVPALIKAGEVVLPAE